MTTTMNILEQLLEDDYLTWIYAGNKASLRLDMDRVVEVSFAHSGTSGIYKGLLIVILNKRSGEITRNVFNFDDYRLDNYVWKSPTNGKKLEWYKNVLHAPSIRTLRESINEWLRLYN